MSVPSPYHRTVGLCIPTYKRPDQLQKCVESLIAAAAPHDVPIFIADDSADDTNDAVLAALQARYPHIIVDKNPRNLGIDGNILHCADLCDCDYAWLIGEDDRMIPEAVATILPLLEREAPAFVAVNYSYVDADFRVVLREKLMPIEADRAEDSLTFFREDAWAIGFLGSCVVRKALWRGVNPAPYVGTYFAHVGVILESIAGRDVHLVARPLVLNRVGGADVFTWSGDAYGVFRGFPQVAHRLAPFYGEDAARAAARAFVHHHGLDTLRFMAAKRADRVYTLEVYRRFVKPEDRGRAYKWTAHLIARMPPQPFRVLSAALFWVRRMRNVKLAGGQ